jgi:hypothetical protein
MMRLMVGLLAADALCSAAVATAAMLTECLHTNPQLSWFCVFACSRRRRRGRGAAATNTKREHKEERASMLLLCLVIGSIVSPSLVLAAGGLDGLILQSCLLFVGASVATTRLLFFSTFLFLRLFSIFFRFFALFLSFFLRHHTKQQQQHGSRHADLYFIHLLRQYMQRDQNK